MKQMIAVYSLVIVMLLLLFFGSDLSHEKQTQDTKPQQDALITYDYHHSGMHYVVVRGPQGGISTINLTLDSVQLKHLNHE